MKIRWNLNEELIKKKEETKVSCENKITPNLQNINIQENIIREKDTINKNFPLYERTKRTHEQLQEKLNLFGTKSANQIESSSFNPLKLLNKNENIKDSKKMILIEKEYEDFNKKNIKDLEYQQIQDKLNLNLKDEENTNSQLEKDETNSNIAIFHLESFLRIDESLVEYDKNISNNYNINKKILNDEYFIEKRIKFPDIIFELINANQEENVNSFTGMFAPLNLLYFVKNEIIYFWDYEQNKMYTFKEIPTKILYIHFAKPKEGIFAPDINNIAIIATTDEIYMILIRRNDDLTFSFLKSDFVVDIGDYYITSICSSDEGRIFLGSQNYNLYELDYSNTYTFFGFFKRANKIIHSQPSIFNKLIPFFLKQNNYIAKLEIDNSRHILYCLIYYTNDQNFVKFDSVSYSSLVVYDLGPDGSKFEKLGEINQESICERYNQINMRQEKEKNFIIKDIFPLTRKDSKYYHLIIVTKNGLRAYISFDIEITNEFIENEEKITQKNKNLIYRCRPTMKYSIVLKPLPEPTNANLFDYRLQDRAYKLFSSAAEKSEKQIFFVENKFVLFYKDEFKKQSFLDIIEFDDTANLKNEFVNSSNVDDVNYVNPNLNLNYNIANNNYYNYSDNENPYNVSNNERTFPGYKNIENIINILNFDFMKEVHGFYKIHNNNKSKTDNFLDFSSLLKKIEKDVSKTNYLDSENFISIDYMNRFSKQIFEIPEQYILFTSSELIYINKKRPIDELFKILLESEVNENQKNILNNEFINFLNKYGISETAYMLLIIYVNYNMKFNYYEGINCDNISETNKQFSEKFNKNLVEMDIVNSSNLTNANYGKTSNFMRQIKNNEVIMKKAFDYYIRLIDFDTIFFNKDVQKGYENHEFNTNVARNRLLNQGRFNIGKDIDNIGRPIIDLPNLKINHVTYSFFMYISRISRIFWEESFYYLKGETKDDFLQESLRIYQIENLITILNEFTLIMSEKKEQILQKCSEFHLKKNTYFQSQQNFQQEKNVYSEETSLQYKQSNLNSFDYNQITNDFSEIFLLCNRITESLKFISYIYDYPALKEHIFYLPKNIQSEFLNYKFKDLIKKANFLTIQNLIEEFFELALKENDCAAVSNKLDEINFVCPKILTVSQKEIITAEMLLKYSEDKHINSIAKKNMIDKAVQLILKNPYKIRLEYVIKVLGDNHKILEVIKICVLKSIYLKNLLDEDYLESFRGMSVGYPSGVITSQNKSNLNFGQSESERNDYYQNQVLNVNTIDSSKNINIGNAKRPFYNPNLESESKINFYSNNYDKTRRNFNIYDVDFINKNGNKYNYANETNKNLLNSSQNKQEMDFPISKRYVVPNYSNLNTSFSGFENIYDLNNYENNYNFCEFKKCLYTILRFLDEIHNSIKNHKNFKKNTKEIFLIENPNDSFSDFFYNNLKEIDQKNLEKNRKTKFSIFSLFKKFGFSNKQDLEKDEKPALSTYESQEELISNLIKDIIYNKFWDFSIEDKIELQNMIIEEILKNEKFKFLHILIFDHFKAKGMTEEILKYKSPYIEEYLRLNAMEKDDYSDLKTNNSLISFYINDKNYIKAFDILIKLAYQDNKIINQEKFDKNAINTSKRIEYLKKADYILDKLLREKGDEEKKNFYSSFKEKITKKISVLEIQNEIIFNLKKLINHQLKINSGIDLTFYNELVNDLNYSIYDIEELYFNYASKFKLHEIKIMILFENFKMKNSLFLNIQEIQNIYFDAISFYVNKDQNYPHSLISFLSTIFVLYIKNHTDFHNFYDAYRHSTPDHNLREIISLDSIINIIENFNWQKIYNENEIDFEKYSKERLDKPNNPFWFILFLNEKAHIPIHLIFKHYVNLKNSEEFKNQKEIIIQFALVFIINKWCDRLEEYIQKLNTSSVKISKDLFADYQEFNKNDGFISNFFSNIHQKIENNEFKIRRDYIVESNLNFIKNIEKKYNSIVKKSIIVSTKFKTPSLYSDDSFYNYSYDTKNRIKEFDLNKKDFQSENNLNKYTYNKCHTSQNFENKMVLNKFEHPNNLISENVFKEKNNLNPQSNIINDRFYLGRNDNDRKTEKNNLFNNDDI